MDPRSSPPSTTAAPARQARKLSVRRRTVITSILAVLAAAALLWFLFAPDPVRVELTQVVQGPMQVTVNNEGQVRVHDKYVVAAPVAAELARIELHDGDPVRKDQVVAVLNPLPMDVRQRQEATGRLESARALAREAGLQAQRARAAWQFAVSERTRVERLVRDNFIAPQAAEKAQVTESTSRAEWEAARSREQAALADARAAQAALASTEGPDGARSEVRLTAPTDGYVLKVAEKSARTIGAGTPLLIIGDPHRYEIVVDVLSTDAVRIQPGQTMLLQGWGGNQTLRARVRQVEPVAFTKVSVLGVEEQRVNVLADPVDPLGPLGDGYRIEARIVIWSGERVTKVAGSSLFRVGDAWHVFTVEGGHARERTVTAGRRNQDEVEIVSGLAPGATVIRYPSNLIDDGTKIEKSTQRGPAQ
jgi:HlyD family secretion protein